MSESDTPDTDATFEPLRGTDEYNRITYDEMTQLARRLERQRNRARAALDAIYNTGSSLVRAAVIEHYGINHH